MPEADDEYLGESPAGDDVAAFEHAVGEYWASVALFALRLLNDREAAKDVSQEAFIRLWLARKHMTDEAVRPFLYRVARNLAVDELRKRSIRARWTEHYSESRQDNGPEIILHEQERHEEVARAIQALAPRRRQALTLAYLHDLSYKDVARVMGISVNTVRNEVSSALTDLRAVLASHRF